MANSQSFALFPRNNVPKLATPSPHKRTPSLHTVKTLNGIDEESSVPLPNGGTIARDLQRSQQSSRSRTPSAENIGIAVTTASPIDGATPSPIRPANIAAMSTPPPPPPPKAYSPRSPQAPSGRSGSATLIADASPIVPVRSMFPVYNPNVALSQQNYYPQRSFAARTSSLYQQSFSREEYRNSITTPIDRQLGSRTAPPSVINFNDTFSVTGEPQFSSHRELEKLWEASHGTEPSTLIKAFDLEMARWVPGCFPHDRTNAFAEPLKLPSHLEQTLNTLSTPSKRLTPVKYRSPRPTR
jgi:hypothetical protein